MDIKVAKIIDDFTIVINKGKKDGLTAGQRFQVYAIGDEIIDPDTNSSLGKLEIIKGTGRIVHLQDAIATIGSDMQASPTRTVKKLKRNNPYSNYIHSFRDVLDISEEEEQVLPPKKVAFEKVFIGDLVRQI
jgi:hypothetical protein